MNENLEYKRPEANAPNPHDGKFAFGIELLSKVLKSIFIILAVSISTMVVYYFIAGGIFTVDTTKNAVIILKFGKYDGVYTQGLHWAFPAPITQKITIPTSIEAVQCDAFLPEDRTWFPGAATSSMTRPPMTVALVPGKDGYLLLGDGNLIHTRWELKYRIHDPLKFYRNCRRNPAAPLKKEANKQDEALRGIDTLLRNMIEDAVVSISSSTDLDDAYFKQSTYQTAVRNKLIENIEELDIGIGVENLTMLFVSPPGSVRPYFDAYQSASARVAETLKNVEAYRTKHINDANIEGTRIMDNARAYEKRITAQADANTEYFRQILVKYRENPQSTLVSLYAQAFGEVVMPTAVQNGNYIISGRPELRLRINAPITKRTEADEHTTEGGAR